MESFLNEIGLGLKRADLSDCKMLFDWTNEEDVRANSFNSRKIDFKEHCNWLRIKLSDSSCAIYICYINEIPIGQIRIEMKNDIGLINYSISKESRGKGYGSLVLQYIPNQIKEEFPHIKILLGKVKPENQASRKAFMRAGYSEGKQQGVYEYTKNINV